MHGRTHASQFISSPRKDTPDARTDLFIFVEICRGRMDAVKTTLDGSVGQFGCERSDTLFDDGKGVWNASDGE